jgi:hypothetical protein
VDFLLSYSAENRRGPPYIGALTPLNNKIKDLRFGNEETTKFSQAKLKGQKIEPWQTEKLQNISIL